MGNTRHPRHGSAVKTITEDGTYALTSIHEKKWLTMRASLGCLTSHCYIVVGN